jgi:hypothetical protein
MRRRRREGDTKNAFCAREKPLILVALLWRDSWGKELLVGGGNGKALAKKGPTRMKSF